jgi:hypothetical protein
VKKGEFIKIINEEISGFDFLGNEQQQQEDEELTLLNNVDFQKQFICDFLLNKKDKYKITDVVESNLNSDWEHDGYLNISYIVEISYNYEAGKKPARFGLWFKGEHIGYNVDSDYDPGKWAGTMPDSIAPSGGDWFDKIDWNYIDVQMFMIDERDDDVKFTAFDSAPERVQNLFVSHFLADFIYKYGDIGVDTPEQHDNITKTGYC